MRVCPIRTGILHLPMPARRWSCPYRTGHVAVGDIARMNSLGERMPSRLCGWLLLPSNHPSRSQSTVLLSIGTEEGFLFEQRAWDGSLSR